jgi:hypothetical protein
MSERLSDEQVAWFATFPLNRTPDNVTLLAREVQAMRRLLNGGPCPWCGEAGRLLRTTTSSGAGHYPPCDNPDCVLGRVPGVIERLEAAIRHTSHPWTDSTRVRRDLGAILARLREAGGR